MKKIKEGNMKIFDLINRLLERIENWIYLSHVTTPHI